MKKLTRVISTMLALFLALLGSQPSMAKNECVHAKADVDLFLVPPTNPNEAPGVMAFVDYMIGDEQHFVEVSFTRLMPQIVTEDGTIKNLFQIQYLFENGDTMTGMDHTVASPTDVPGEFRALARIDIDSGTGRFVNSYGKIMGHGTFSLVTGMGKLEAKGRLCGPWTSE